MHLILLAADLLPPPAFVPPQDLPRLPALDWLLAKGDTRHGPGAFLEEALLAECACVVPVAPLTLLADGGAPGKDTWLRADPVHLSVQRDNVQLLDAHVLEPTLAEAKALAATLNAHLQGDGIAIEVHHDSRWYLRVPAGEVPDAAPLWRMSGASVFERLPAATGKINWRVLQNEIAMLLHDHPVNQAREDKGRPAINGLWFWGGGALTEWTQTGTPFRMAAHLALARGIALHQAQTLLELPQNLAALPPSEASTVAVLHQATRALRTHSAHAWHEAVAALHAEWFAPAAARLNEGALTHLTLILPNEAQTLVCDATPKARWRFWRGVRPWNSHG